MEFTVQRIGGAWAVTSGSLIHAKRDALHLALTDAIRAASNVASPHLKTVVTLEEGDEDTKRVVWASLRDS